MVAIVTDTLKNQMAKYLYDEVSTAGDSNEYYIGIGKTDTYDSSDTTITPVRHTYDDRITRGNFESIKKVAAASFVIPRYSWASGTTYASWNDKQAGVGTNPYYVLTEDNEVYICLQQSKDNTTGAANPSTVKPSFTDAGVTQVQSFETSDGYRWKLLYAVSAGNASNFLTAGFLPVELVTVDSSAASAFQLQQIRIQQEAANIKGQILGVEVVSGGSGYTSAPTLSFRGNGTGATATATVVGGQIVKVVMDNESSGLGTGYDFASVSQSGGGSSSANLRPIIGPRDGFGADPRKDLKSSSLMFNSKPAGEENGDFNITNDFRQISLIKGLNYTDSAADGGIFSATSAQINRRLTVTTDITTTGFAVDEIITGGTSGTTALVDKVDSGGGNQIFFHQNEKTTNGTFTDGETLSGNLGGTGTIDSGNLFSEVDIYSGDLLYIENRARIVRSSAQTEDIKIIITV